MNVCRQFGLDQCLVSAVRQLLDIDHARAPYIGIHLDTHVVALTGEGTDGGRAGQAEAVNLLGEVAIGVELGRAHRQQLLLVSVVLAVLCIAEGAVTDGSDLHWWWRWWWWLGCREGGQSRKRTGAEQPGGYGEQNEQIFRAHDAPKEELAPS